MSNGGGIGGKSGNFGSEPPEMGIIWSLECPLGVVVSTLIGMLLGAGLPENSDVFFLLDDQLLLLKSLNDPLGPVHKIKTNSDTWGKIGFQFQTML